MSFYGLRISIKSSDGIHPTIESHVIITSGRVSLQSQIRNFNGSC